MKADILKEYGKQIAQISMEHSGLGDPTCLDMDMQRLISSVFDRGFEEGKKAGKEKQKIVEKGGNYNGR
jgi:hypothetical protein